MKKFIFFLALVVTGFIFYSSLQPAYLSNLTSKSLLQYLQSLLHLLHLDELLTNHILRKLAHFTEFFIQGLLLTLFFFLRERKGHNYAVYALLIGFLTALADEYIQQFVPGRAGMFQDVLLDFTGTVFGTIIGTKICRFLVYRKNV